MSHARNVTTTEKSVGNNREKNSAQNSEPCKAKTPLRYNLVSAGLAFVLWGGWAWHVNTQSTSDASSASPLVSALTQGTGSFLITLLMVNIVSWLYNKLPGKLSLVLPTLITVMFTGSCMAIAHILVGTPDVIRTIAPGITVAVFFNLYTTFLLSRNRGSENRASENRGSEQHR